MLKPATPPIRVVLVDDHEMVMQSFQRVLDGEPDITVVGAAATVAEGVGTVSAAVPDVVVLDYQLPDGTGLDAAERILSELPRTRILLLTGADVQGVAAAALGLGCAGYLEKTGAAGALVAAVRRVHRGEAVVSSDQLRNLVESGRRGRERTGPGLTDREGEVLQLLSTGASNKSIAATLDVSLNTVRTHVQTILGKLGAHSRLEAVALAREQGLISLR